MNARAWLAAALTLGMTTAALALYDADKAAPAADHAVDCPEVAGCATCHQGEMPTTHDAEFFADRHGDAALAQRAACAGCHAQSECDACHAERTPLWHDARIARPGLDLEARHAHASLGRDRREDCLACHEQNFRAHCSACHSRTEFLR